MPDDTPIQYIERSRAYYEAQGYPKPYQWSKADGIPFRQPAKPLSASKATIITTAMPDDSYADEHRRLYVGKFSETPEAFFTGGLFWDRDATHTDDRETYFPVKQLQARITSGEIGSLAEHYYCVPTIYSYSRTQTRDAPAIAKQCLSDGVDIAFLIPL
ncbi:MAG: hypothetical protein ACU84Q_19395 [Gammaproteobacteria bacterium]